MKRIILLLSAMHFISAHAMAKKPSRISSAPVLFTSQKETLQCKSKSSPAVLERFLRLHSEINADVLALADLCNQSSFMQHEYTRPFIIQINEITKQATTKELKKIACDSIVDIAHRVNLENLFNIKPFNHEDAFFQLIKLVHNYYSDTRLHKPVSSENKQNELYLFTDSDEKLDETN